MSEFISFPPSFWWGAATSGPQSEGEYRKPHQNVMDYWFDHNPEDFFHGVGPTVASDFYHTYAEDFRLMKQIGMNSFRTSIQWSRLIKDLETGEVDEDAVNYYNCVIDEAKHNGIELVLNLHHFDLPIELYEKYGGWESKHVVDLFVLFAEKVFTLFGDRVKYFTTFNEPMVIPEAGYLYGFHYPKIKGEGKRAMQVVYNLNLASAKVISLYHEMELGGKIGIILNLTPSLPETDSPEDLKAAQIADTVFNRSFLDPAVKSQFPSDLVELLEKDGVMWDSTVEEMEVLHSAKVDFLGVNYYHPKRVRAQRNPQQFTKWTPDIYMEEYQDPTKRINPYRGWEIYPKSIYDIAINIRDHYDNIPWFISENGMGVENEERFMDQDGYINDDYRIDFYKEHLAWLHKAMEEGCNCFGYHTWTAFDCWSWNNAYKNRYGFISIDLKSQKRTIKKSGHWYKTVSDSHGFVYDLPEKIG